VRRAAGTVKPMDTERLTLVTHPGQPPGIRQQHGCASGERTQMKPEPAVPGGRAGEVMALAGGQVLALLGRQRCEDPAELLHHAVVQHAGVADPGHPEPGEFAQGRGGRDA